VWEREREREKEKRNGVNLPPLKLHVLLRAPIPGAFMCLDPSWRIVSTVSTVSTALHLPQRERSPPVSEFHDVARRPPLWRIPQHGIRTRVSHTRAHACEPHNTDENYTRERAFTNPIANEPNFWLKNLPKLSRAVCSNRTAISGRIVVSKILRLLPWNCNEERLWVTRLSLVGSPGFPFADEIQLIRKSGDRLFRRDKKNWALSCLFVIT